MVKNNFRLFCFFTGAECHVVKKADGPRQEMGQGRLFHLHSYRLTVFYMGAAFQRLQWQGVATDDNACLTIYPAEQAGMKDIRPGF